MKIYVYLDESGSIHKNSNTRFFAVGGYFVIEDNKTKVTSLYKKINKEIKDSRNIPLEKEIKSYNFLVEEKIRILTSMEKISYYCAIAIVFDKTLMNKDITTSNIFFNYAVKVLFKDCIMPILGYNILSTDIIFVLSVDNRNIRVGDLKNLENYLLTEFCIDNIVFRVTYYDSATNFGIQLADLIVNTFYNSCKDITLVEKVLNSISKSRYRVSVFPGSKKYGRFRKILYNNKKDV